MKDDRGDLDLTKQNLDENKYRTCKAYQNFNNTSKRGTELLEKII